MGGASCSEGAVRTETIMTIKTRKTHAMRNETHLSTAKTSIFSANEVYLPEERYRAFIEEEETCFYSMLFITRSLKRKNC